MSLRFRFRLRTYLIGVALISPFFYAGSVLW